MRDDIEARIDALQDLLLAHVIATSPRLQGGPQATLRVAESMRAGAMAREERGRAKALDALLDHLREAFGLPVND